MQLPYFAHNDLFLVFYSQLCMTLGIAFAARHRVTWLFSCLMTSCVELGYHHHQLCIVIMLYLADSKPPLLLSVKAAIDGGSPRLQYTQQCRCIQHFWSTCLTVCLSKERSRIFIVNAEWGGS